jgi:photosystem II stability/assembly factor-like uncharacterized protein
MKIYKLGKYSRLILCIILIISFVISCSLGRPVSIPPTGSPSLITSPEAEYKEMKSPTDVSTPIDVKENTFSIENNTWTSIGPEGAGVRTMVIDPKTPTTLYVGTWGGGVFKTTNGGENWSAASTGLTDRVIYSLAIDPMSPNNIYAMTQSIIFKSTNSGENWSDCGKDLSNSSDVPSTIDTPIPSTFYSSGVNIKDLCEGNPLDTANLDGLQIYPLGIFPSNSTVIYAIWSDSKLYKSLDGGVNWMLVNSELSFAPEGVLSITTIKIDPKTPNTLYAAVDDQVFKSTNGGENWSAASTGLTTDRIIYLEIDPKSPNNIYLGIDKGLFRSENGGENWSEVGTDMNGLYIYTLVIDPVTPTTLYLGTSDGVYKSINRGDNWKSESAGLNATHITTLAFTPKLPTTLYAAGKSVYKHQWWRKLVGRFYAFLQYRNVRY